MTAVIASLFLTFVLLSNSLKQYRIGKIVNRAFHKHYFADKSESLWNERIQFVDLMSPPQDDVDTARPMPLFLLGSAFYPSGTSVLHVFEMKYRTMMSDCAKTDDTFGYIIADAQTGTL